MITMLKGCRSAAIRSAHCERSWRLSASFPRLHSRARKPGRRYRVAGLVLVRQRPGTAKGITFMTIEDETGTANLIVRPQVWERYRRVGRLASAIIASGLLQRQDGVIHLIVDRLEDVTSRLPDLGHVSRDFH